MHLSHALARPENVLYLSLEINGSSRQTAGSGEDSGSERCGINSGKWAWNDANGRSLLNPGWECGCSHLCLVLVGWGEVLLQDLFSSSHEVKLPLSQALLPGSKGQDKGNLPQAVPGEV